MGMPPTVATPPPPPASRTIDFGRGFRFVFEDPDWIKKMLIGGGMAILGMVIVGAIWLMGYWVRLVQRVARGEERPLPEWDDWGGLFADGLRAAGVYFAYILGALLPIILLVVGVIVFGTGLSHMARGSGSSDAIGGLMGLGMLGLYAVAWLLMMVLMIYLPAALARFALTGRLGAGFEVMENLSFIRRNALNYALSLVLYLIGSFAAQLGVLLCCVGMFPISFWALCLLGWGLGETARLDGTTVS
jgi:Protein of unknown function (DUF4013)